MSRATDDRLAHTGHIEGWIWELSIPLAAPFATAAERVDERRVVVVSVTDGVVVGWGEAAPYPGVTPDSVGDAWQTLERGSVLSPTAAAAFDEASADFTAPGHATLGVHRRSGTIDPVIDRGRLGGGSG